MVRRWLNLETKPRSPSRVMLETLQNLDLWLLHKVNLEWTNPVFDRLFPTLSSFEAWTPVFVIIILTLLLRGGTRMRLLLLAIGIGIGLGDALISSNIKSAVGRLRPNMVRPEVIKRDLPKSSPLMLSLFHEAAIIQTKLAKPGERGKSFPSSHTINMFSMAAACCFVFGRRAWWAVLVAAMVGWSRTYCGVHWPSDVLFSVPIGVLCGWVSVTLVNALWKRQGPRYFPLAWAKTPDLLTPHQAKSAMV